MTGPTPPVPDRIGPGSLDAAMLRIRTAQGDPAGLGFLVTDRLALTCAHVVTAALRLPKDSVVAPGTLVSVDLALGSGPVITASVEQWVSASDSAVLWLATPLPGARPVRLVEQDEVWGHPARAYGLPKGRPGGVWHSAVLRHRQGNGLVQADLLGDGYRVSPGFSGSPVWDDELAGVVGMVAQAEPGQPPTSYLIPTSGLLAAWPGLRGLVAPPSPFRALRPFLEADATIFHGRQAETGELAGIVGEQRWTTLVGPSGCGKSSLAMAGIMPSRRASGDCPIVLRPGHPDGPLHALAAALVPLLEPDLSVIGRFTKTAELATELARHGLRDVVPPVLELTGAKRLLVVVDQLEELLDVPESGIDDLAGVLFDNAPASVAVLGTLRADFLEPLLAHPRLGPVVSRRVCALEPMRPDQLREIITRPIAESPGVRYEPNLPERILADTGTDPGALPLLGFTLDLLWERLVDDRGVLTHHAYEAIGGVGGALGDYAQRAWAENIPAEEEPVAHRLLTKLVRVPIGSAAATRRIVPRADLNDKDREWQIAQRLAATRLLVIKGDDSTQTVELAHEALITNWPRLARQTTADRSFLDWRESLQHDLDRWQHGEQAADLLPTSTALAVAQEWLPARDDELSKPERDYLDRGRAYRRKQTRTRRALFTGLVIVVVAAVLLGSLFWSAQRNSSEQQALANSRALAQAAQDSADYDPALSVLTAVAAYRTAPTEQARNQLLREYLEYSDSDRVLSGLLGNIAVFNTSRDGNVVLAGTDLGRATLFVHAASGAVRSEPIPAGYMIYALVSPDGRRAAFVDEDGTAGWFDIDQNASNPVGPVHKLPAVAQLMDYENGPQDAAAMSADGTLVAVRTSNSLVWWNLDRGTIAGSVPTPPGAGNGLWLSTDKRTLLVRTFDDQDPDNLATGLVAVDMTTGRTRTVVTPAQDNYLLVSGDRSAVAVCQNVGSGAVIRLQRVSDGAQEGRPYSSSSPCDELAAIDPTGRRTVIQDGVGNLVLVDLYQGAQISDIAQTPGTVGPLMPCASNLISSGGKLLLACHGDAQIAYDEVPTSPDVITVDSQVLARDGSATISLLDDGSLQLRPAGSDSDRLLASAPSPQAGWDESDNVLRVNRDRSLVVDREARNVVTVRDTTTLRQTARITTIMPPDPPPNGNDATAVPGKPDNYFDYFFDWSGHLVTVAGAQVQEWDPRTGQQLAHFDAAAFLASHGDVVSDTSDVGIGPYPTPNQLSVLLRGDPVIRIVDLTTGQVVSTIKTTTDVGGIQFDPTGRYFALLHQGGVVELWQRDPLQRKVGPLRGLTGISNTPWWAGFLDGNGHYLIAANDSIRIYQIGQQAPDSYEFGHPDGTTQQNPYLFMDVSNDARTVLYSDERGLGGPLVLDPATWVPALCAITGYRGFTADEQASLPAPIPTSRVCPAPR